MGRIIAVDYGTKRVGIAVTDPMRIIASPLETVHSSELVDFLEKYIMSEEVDVLVIGLPKRLDNTDSDITQLIREFTVYMSRKFPQLEIVNVDERFTSKIAFNAMIDGGLKKKKRQDKGTIDRLSATVILQSYMEQQL